MACWRNGMLAKWHVGKMACWRNDKLAKRQVSKMAFWRNGKLAKWWVGNVSYWGNVRAPNGRIYSLQRFLYRHLKFEMDDKSRSRFSGGGGERGIGKKDKKKSFLTQKWKICKFFALSAQSSSKQIDRLINSVWINTFMLLIFFLLYTYALYLQPSLKLVGEDGVYQWDTMVSHLGRIQPQLQILD